MNDNADAIVAEMEVDSESTTSEPSVPVEIAVADNATAYSDAVDEMIKLIAEGEKGSADADAKCMMEMFQRIKKDDGEIKFSPYNKMTDSLKSQVRFAASKYGIRSIQDVQSFAKTMVMQMYQDATVDKAWAKLQEDIRRTNRIPEQMDIFGSVLYDRMVCGALIKSIVLKEKDPENFKDDNVFVRAANIFLDNMFFLRMMESFMLNVSRVKKGERNIKRVLDDIDDLFTKVGISIDKNTTSASAVYGGIKSKFDETKATYLMLGVNYVLETCVDGSVDSLQTAFVLSLINGILTYINLDSEVQTEQGKLLLTNFSSYIDFCTKLLSDDIEGAKQVQQLAMEVKTELYSNELVRAQKKYEENIASQINEAPEQPTE